MSWASFFVYCASIGLLHLLNPFFLIAGPKPTASLSFLLPTFIYFITAPAMIRGISFFLLRSSLSFLLLSLGLFVFTKIILVYSSQISLSSPLVSCMAFCFFDLNYEKRNVWTHYCMHQSRVLLLQVTLKINKNGEKFEIPKHKRFETFVMHPNLALLPHDPLPKKEWDLSSLSVLKWWDSYRHQSWNPLMATRFACY